MRQKRPVNKISFFSESDVRRAAVSVKLSPQQMITIVANNAKTLFCTGQSSNLWCMCVISTCNPMLIMLTLVSLVQPWHEVSGSNSKLLSKRKTDITISNENILWALTYHIAFQAQNTLQCTFWVRMRVFQCPPFESYSLCQFSWVVSCPGQLTKWPRHSLTHSLTQTGSD